jgi:hypothetical protein
MSDPDPETDETDQEVEEKIEELENQIEKIEERQQGRNQITVQSHSIQVHLSSEDCSMRDLARIASSEMEEREKMAMVGEYQVIEEEDMFEFIL